MGSKVLKGLGFGAIAVGAVLGILAGVLGWVVVPDIIKDKVEEETRLVEDSDTYEKWTDLPVPINLNVYFFHVLNYQDYVNSGNWSQPPKIVEIGPFVWTEKRVKYDIKVNEDEDTISYRQIITYHWNETLSGPGLTDDMELTLVNIPFIAAITLLDIYPVTRKLAPAVLQSLIASGETIFSPGLKPKEIVFEGVKLKPVYKVVEETARALGIPLPDEISNGTFAVYRGKNNTNAEGVWEVYRGVKDSSKFSIVKSVNDGKTNLTDWWNDECAMINGTDGTMFPPFIKKDSLLYVYAAEICRSIFLEYDSEIEYEGIPGYRFIIPEKLFTSPKEYPPNQCFCIDVMKPLNDSCDFNGMGRLFSCKANVPIAISKPHFLDADEWVQAEARKYGLSPRRDKHDTYLDLEPNTGFPLRVHKRIQIGVEMQSYKTETEQPIPEVYSTIPHIIYPIIWADESAELTEELIDEIKTKLIKPLNYVKIGKWTLVGVGAFLLVGGVMFTAFQWNK